MNESNVARISDDDLFEALAAFRENLAFLVEEGEIVSMTEFTKVRLSVQILEKELLRRNKDLLKSEKIGNFTVFSRKKKSGG